MSWDIIEIVRGASASQTLVTKFGRNPSIDTTTDPEDVWASGGLMSWPTAAGTVSVTSGSANDDDGQSGARKITIEGLDASFNSLSETITMDGATPATTAGSFLRIHRAFVSETGAYHGTNEGDIVGQIGGNTMFTILTGYGQTEIARYTIPAGRTGYIIGGDVQVGIGGASPAAGVASIALYQVPNADDVATPFGGAKRLVRYWDAVSAVSSISFRGALKFVEKTDLWFRVEAVGANSTSVNVNFELVLIDN